MMKMMAPLIFPPASEINFALFVLDKLRFSQHIVSFYLLIFPCDHLYRFIYKIFDI